MEREEGKRKGFEGNDIRSGNLLHFFYQYTPLQDFKLY